MNKSNQTAPVQIYEIYIKAKPEKIWMRLPNRNGPRAMAIKARRNTSFAREGSTRRARARP